MRKFFFITIAGLGLLCLAQPVLATSYFVSPTGNNSHTGTSGSPWLTIQKAANTMVAGDTVTVAAGTYPERVSETTSGSAGNLITYQTIGTVITKGFQIAANYVKITGFSITGTADGWSTGPGVYVTGQYVQVVNNSIYDTASNGIFYDASPADSSATSNGLIQGNTILRPVGCGIRVQGQNHLVESNDISHSRQWQPGVNVWVSGADADGMLFFGSGHTFRTNYVHDILFADAGNKPFGDPDAPHIDGFQTYGPASNMLFEKNLFNIPGNDTQGGQIGVVTAPITGLTFKNNIFINGSTGYGPGLNFFPNGSTISNLTVVNNTFVRSNGQGTYGVRFQTGVATATLRNNSFYNIGNASFSYVEVGSGTSGITVGYNGVYTTGAAPAGGAFSNDQWMVNPLYVNLGTGDYHLQSGSPLVNTGLTIGTVTDDYDNVSRPQGAGYEIGAFEFVAATITLTQVAYRFESFGGTESVADYTKSLNVGATISPNSCIRIRGQISNTIASMGSTGYVPYAQRNGSGGYAAVANGPCTSTGICLASGTGRLPPELVAGVTTEKLAGSGTFVAGRVQVATNDSTTVTLASGQDTEMLVAACVGSGNSAGDYFDLRWYRAGGTALTAYTQTPRITIGGYVSYRGNY